MAGKKKKPTKTEIRRRMLRPIDTRSEYRDSRVEAARVCRWLEKAMRLYGRRRVVAAMRAWASGSYSEEVLVEALLDYLERWKAGQDRHIIPWTVVSEPWFLADNITPFLVLAPRVGQVKAPAPKAVAA